MPVTGKQVQGVFWVVLGCALLVVFCGWWLVRLGAALAGLIAINYGRKFLALPPLWVPIMAWFATIKEWLDIA